MKNKYLFIHLEGIDKSGKSSIKTELVALDPSLVVFDRSVISNIVYSKLNNREVNTAKLFTNLFSLDNRHVFVHVGVSQKEFEARHKKHGEKDLLVSDYNSHSSMFSRVFSAMQTACTLQCINIDTSSLTPAKAAKQIYNELHSNRP